VHVGLPRDALRRPLNCVLCILSIAKYSEHRAVDPQLMTLIQLPESALRRMQAFVAGPTTTIQIMVKDSNGYAGRLGIRPIHFRGGEPLDMVLDQTCFP